MNIIQSLKNNGMSLDVIAEAGAISYAVVANSAEGDDLKDHVPDYTFDKLKRLEEVISNVKPINGIKSGDFFEKHILTQDSDNGVTEWINLSTLWSNGIISDEELAQMMKNPLNTMDRMIKKFEDGSLEKAEPCSYMNFRSQFTTI